MPSKQCSKCSVVKDFSEFYNKTSSKDGKLGACKECRKAYDKARYDANRDEISAANRERWHANGDRYKARKREWRLENIEHCKQKDRERYLANRDEEIVKRREWYQKNRHIVLEQKKVYYQENKEEINAKIVQRIKDDPIFRMSRNARERVRHALKRKGWDKDSPAQEIIGCTWKTLKRHIERQFEDGMTWDNYGSEWHIDHIIPLAIASTEKEVLSLCHYKNLQPLWAEDNLRKGGKLPEGYLL